MEKTEVIRVVLEDLGKDAADIQTAIDYAWQEARSSPSGTEPQSDGRRREQYQLAIAHQTAKQRIENAIRVLRMLDPNVEPTRPGIGSFIKTDFNNKDQWYFIVPYGGGKTLTVDGETIITLSPESPLGEKVLKQTEAQ